MELMNLFSKPLDFNCTGSSNETVAVLRDKSATPVEFISKPLVISQVGMLGNHLQKGANMPKINDSSQHGRKKRKPNKSLKKKNKMPKYADHDGLLISCENRNSSMENWPGSRNNDALAPDHDGLGRSIICYEDPVFSSTKSKKQRSRQLKAAKKNHNNNINNNIKNNVNTSNKKKSKNKKPHMKNISQKGSDNILNKAAPSYLSHGFSSSLKALEASCSIVGGPDGKSLKRKADDVDEGRSKLRRVYDEWTPIFDDKKLVVEPTEVTKMINKKSKEPLSKSKLRKIEKSKRFWEKRKEKETRDAAHQQGLQRKIVPCKFYVNGCCSKGTECTFSHDIPQVKKDEQCKFYVMSQCTKEGCLYRHGEWPCKFFHGQKGCRNNSCKFSHEPLTEITKKWLDKIVEGDSAIKSENGEKEDKVEEFNIDCSTLERTVDSFYGSSANQTLPNMMQPKQESEVHCEAGQKLDMNKIHDVSTWRCSGDFKASNNFDVIRIETPDKRHTSLFEFFKHKIESHRSNEFKDRCLYSPVEMVISKMQTHSSQNSIACHPYTDSYRCNAFVKSLAQESVLPYSFKPSTNIQHSDNGLQAPIKTNSDIFCSPSSTMMVPEGKKNKSKGMMCSTNNGSSPVIKPLLIDNCRGPASLKASGISYAPFLTTKTAFYELKSNEITSSSVQHNERIPQNKGDSELFSASQLHDSMEMEFNYDKEEAKPIEKQRSLINEPSSTYEKIPINNKKLSTSPNMVALFSTPLSFSSETEATYVRSKSKLQNMDDSYVSDTLTNLPVINATLQTSSSTVCMLQDYKVTGLLPTPFSFSSMKAGVPCITSELESNKRALPLKDDEASMNNQKFPLNQQLSTKGNRLFSTPLSFSSNKTHLNNGKIELGYNGNVQKNEALNNVESIIAANPESATSLNDLGLFSKPLSFSSLKSDMTRGPNKVKSEKSLKDYLNCYSDLNTTFPTPSSAELNGLFSTPLSFSLTNADTSSNTNGKMPNGEVLNIKPTITSNQESSISSNNLKLFSTPLSFSTKTETARDTGKKKSSKCAEVNELFSTPLSFSLTDADTSSNTNGKMPNGEVLNIKPIITSNQESSISSNNLKLFSTPLLFSTKTETAPDTGTKKSSKSVKDHLTCHSVLNNNLPITSSKKFDGLSSITHSFSSANADMLPFSAIKTKSITSKAKSKKMADPLVSHPLICHSIINANLPIPTTTKVTGLASTSLLSSSITDKSCNSNELELNNETSIFSQTTVDQHLSAKAPGLFSTPLSFTPTKTVLACDAKDLKSQDKLNSLNKKIMFSKTNKPISTKNKGTSELLSVPFSPPLMKTEPSCGTEKTLKSVKGHLSCDFGLTPTSRKVTRLFSNPLSFHPEIPSSTNESETIEKATPSRANRAMNQQLSPKASALFSTPLSFTATESEMTCVTSKLSMTNSLVSDSLTCHSIDANQQTPTTPTLTLFSTPLSFSSMKAEMPGFRNELKCNENVMPFQDRTTSMVGHSIVSMNQQIPDSVKPLGLFTTPLTFHLTNSLESACDTRELKSKDMPSLLAKDSLICHPIIEANLQTPTEAFGISSTEFKSERNEIKLKHQNQTLITHAGSSNMQIRRNESATGLFLTPLSFPSSNGDINP